MEREPKTLDEILEGLSQGEVDFMNFQIIDQVNEPAADKIALDVESEPTTAAATNSKQFRKVNADEVDNFLKNQQNRNTKRKTEQDLSVFKAYLVQCGEGRQPEVIPPSELDANISMFLLFVKRKGGSDYEPTTLRSYVGSLDRYLKENNYPVGLMCDLQFKKCRTVLKTKQKQLKGMGKGNELTDMELEQLYETNTLGMQSPAALLYSMWMICTMHFGMRPGKETHDLKWGDFEQKTDVENGEEYIVNSQERQTKTRTCSNPHDLRKVKPRAYALPGIVNKDPVALYKMYASKPPTAMNDPDKPFFLTINRNANTESSNSKWYKNCPMGINKMCQTMTEMKEASGLETDRRLTNYSVRQRLVQKLNDSGVPPIQIDEITGHKNVNSLDNYSRLNSDQCKGISNILSTGEGNRGVLASTTICRESAATSGPNQQPFPSVGVCSLGTQTSTSP